MTTDSYRRFFRLGPFWKKLPGLARTAGLRSVYTALLLYYAYERKDTPAWAKRTILGALGYLLMPLDVIPDLTPILGYTDDFTVLAAGLTTVAAYINSEVKENAQARLATWFPAAEAKELNEIDENL
ncbi:YkvA family protein [Lewinella sp. IMCC34191]|uniref:YkvA family protein n=1 Tax=Lewinella sp. IMCC34191 TaxID=2259172 RepID=UPI000E234936|nr:YkvA family protein [Lewinella sp. IMCC34191]